DVRRDQRGLHLSKTRLAGPAARYTRLREVDRYGMCASWSGTTAPWSGGAGWPAAEMTRPGVWFRSALNCMRLTARSTRGLSGADRLCDSNEPGKESDASMLPSPTAATASAAATGATRTGHR